MSKIASFGSCAYFLVHLAAVAETSGMAPPALSALTGPVTRGALFMQEARLSEGLDVSEAHYLDQLGYCVAIDGDTLAVGAPYADTPFGNTGGDHGAIHIYTKPESKPWTHQATIRLDELVNGNYNVGYYFALDGDTLIVRARGVEGTGRGLYSYVRSGSDWSLQQWFYVRRLPSNAYQDADAVALDGDTLVAGCAFASGGSGLGSSGAVGVFARSGSTWIQQQYLQPADPVEFGNYGTSVSVSGDSFAVGAPNTHPDGQPALDDAGAVYVYQSGVFQAKLVHPAPAINDEFGRSVAIAGDTLVIGAPLDDTSAANTGSAHVFTRSGGVWTLEASLTASDAAASDEFGASVSISGETIIVGSRLDNAAAGSDQGSSYVYTRSAGVWTQQAKITASDAGDSDRFGQCVMVDGDVAVIGADLYDQEPGDQTGSAYVFERSGSSWSELQNLFLDVGEFTAGDRMGWAVAAGESTVVVGAPLDDINPNVVDVGSVYVFVHDGMSWSKQAKLLASDAASGGMFGSAVALDGDRLIVGAPRSAASTSAAYIFERTGSTWTQQIRLVPADPIVNGYFGTAVTIDGDTAVVTSLLSNDVSTGNAGAAYVYVFNGSTWVLQAKISEYNADPATRKIGRSVDLEGDNLAVGLETYTGSVSTQGGVLIFTRTGSIWSGEALLLASDPASGDEMGHSVAISGDTVLSGAHREGPTGSADHGSVYAFVKSGGSWSEQAKLLNPEPGFKLRFGHSVDVEGDVAIAGQGTFTTNGANGAYLFKRTGTSWVYQGALLYEPDEPLNANYRFGHAVSLHGSLALIGAPGYVGEGGLECGEAFVFQLSKPSCNSCPGDMDASMALDGLDVAGFAACAAQTGSNCVCSDFDEDGLEAGDDMADDTAAFVDALLVVATPACP